MLRYFVGRILILIPTLLIVLFVTFLLGYLGPVDPVMIIARDNAARGIYFTPAQIADLRHQYGLDRPFLVQFGTYLNNLLHGNFGYSYRDAAPVLPRIIAALPVSGSLALGAMVILIVLGIPLGILAARFHNTLIDYLIVGGSLFLNAVPVYVLVPVSLIVFVLWLDLMTVPRGWKGVFHPHFVLAAALMSLRTLAVVIRQTRAGMLDVLANDYVRTARAKGLREIRVMTRHVLRNSLIPVVTQLGLMVDDFMWGAVFIDLAFNLPGLGRLFEQGLGSRDFNFIYGVVIFTAFLTMLINLLIDLLYPLLDPRVMYD
ncbi:MAG: ABC transporter permease [Caldilinea sp. CFX5]|nr:ABC transporter permease [Caldilinea sp. CFX5]